MATQRRGVSWWGQRWAEIMKPIDLARNTIKRIAKKTLSYLNEKLTSRNEYGMIRPFQLIFRMYEMNHRINRMSTRRQFIILTLLRIILVVSICVTFYYCATSDSPRRPINTSIGKFEYPSLPQRSRKVFLFFKISFGICMAYNMLKYLVEMFPERVALMNHLEAEARTITPGQSTEARLDSTVPRVGDDSKTEKARQLIAMRRLYHRGEFKFDVMPEPEPFTVYEPTEDDVQELTDAAVLEAVRRVKDPIMLREYTRKQEAKRGRRLVRYDNLAQRQDKVTLRDWTMACALNVLDKEENDTPSSLSSNESLISNKSRTSRSSKTDTAASTSKRSLRMSEEAPMKIDEDPFTFLEDDVLKTSPTIRARKVMQNRIPGMPRPRIPTPLRGSAGPTNVNLTSGARATAVGAAKAPTGVVAAGTKRSLPLQAAKWPVSGTCRPVRYRTPSPDISPTVLKPPGVSPGGQFSSASKQRRTPSAGPGPKASTVTATVIEREKRYSRPAVRRVAPSSPPTVTSPSRSRATPPKPSMPVSSPTRRPNSSVRRYTLPPTTSSRIPRPVTRERKQPPSIPTPSPQAKTPQSPTTLPSNLPPEHITPPGTPATTCVIPPNKRLPTSIMNMSMDMDMMAKGGGETPCSSAKLSPATSFVNTPAIHQEPTKSSPVRQEPPSAPTSPPLQPQHSRTRTRDGGFSAATAGLQQSAAEGVYEKWNEYFASPKPPMTVIPHSQFSISNESFKLSCTSVCDQTATHGKEIIKDSGSKENAGGDSHTHTSLKDQNSDQIEQEEKKSETEISNLFDPRSSWSDSGSSLSWMSPSFKNICQAYAEDVAINGPPMYD